MLREPFFVSILNKDTCNNPDVSDEHDRGINIMSGSITLNRTYLKVHAVAGSVINASLKMLNALSFMPDIIGSFNLFELYGIDGNVYGVD